MSQPGSAWVALVAGLLFNAAANILIKLGSQDGASLDAKGLTKHFLDPYLIAGVLSFGVALAFYSWALTRFELSVAYPIMTSVGLVLVFIVSVLWLGESAPWTKWAGTGLIIAGVVLVAR